MSNESSNWQKTTLYGVEHSPWLQGVRLALAHHHIPNQLTSYPLSFSWFWHNGLVFPVLQLPDGTTVRDSFGIYQFLEANGYPLGLNDLSDEAILDTQIQLENLFNAYVLGRCGPGKNWAFIRAWSAMRELPHSSWGTLWRALITHYFWILIRLGIWQKQKTKRNTFDLNYIARHLDTWNQKLSSRIWLTGDEMGAFDFALLGHLQCMCSGLTDEVLPLIQQQPHLMRWLELMMRKLPDYDPMYTRRVFEPDAVVNTASVPHRMLFWVVWFISLLGWPITLPFVALAIRNRFKNPARSGGMATKRITATDR